MTTALDQRFFPRAALVISLAAICCTLLFVSAAEPDGKPAATPDTFQYFSMGQHIAAGDGFWFCCLAWDSPPGSDPPITADWGPGFPLFLAGLQKAGLDPQGRALVWANAGLLGVSLLLMGALAYHFTRHAGWAALAVLLLMGGAFADSHLYALSEPLFMLLLLGGIVALVAHLESGSRWALMGAALLLGMAWLTRYAGIVFVEIATGAVVLRTGQPRRRRLENAVIFALIANLPVTVWNMYTQSLPADRVRRFGLGLFSLREIVTDTADALLHLFGQPVFTLLFLVGGALLAARAGQQWWVSAAGESRWERRISRATRPAGMLAIMAVAYAVFIPATASIRCIRIEPRLFVPLAPLLVLMLIAGVRTLTGTGRKLAVGALLVIIVLRFPAFYDEAQARFQSRAEVENDALFAWIKTNLDGASLYSNNFDYLWYMLPGADVHDLPLHTENQLPEFVQMLQANRGYVIFMDYQPLKEWLLRESDVIASQQFDLVMTLPRARVYRAH